MKIILFFAIVIFVFYLIFNSADWSESENKVKQNVGCTVMAVLVIGGILLTLLGTVKSCADISSPSREYYDSPRK